MASEISSSSQAVSKSAHQAAKVKSYVNHQLEKTRKQVKSVDLIAGGLVLVAFVVGFLMLAVLVDGWIWPLPGWARWACLVFLIAGCASYTLSSIVPLLLKRINPDYAAKMIEEAKPSFQNSLLNYVSLRKKPEAIKPAVFDAVSRQAASNLATVPEDATVDRSKLIRLGFVLIGLTLFAVGYKMLSPKDPLQTIARIVYPGGKIAKPAIVNITDVDPGDARVFFGERLVVTAMVRGRHNPEDVRLIYSTLDGQHVEQTILMNPEGGLDRYGASLSMAGGGIQQSLRYQIVARDGASPEYEVTVQPNPAITIESLVLQPPAYTKMRERTLAGQGDIDAIEGTRVSVHAVANLPIKLAYIELLNEVRDPNQPIGEIDYDSRYRPAATPVEMQIDGTSANGNFLITLNSSRQKPIASHYRIRFVSTDDNRNRQPNVYPIRIIPDLAPEIRIRNPDARDIEIPVNASFPILLEANDLDFEIKSVGLNVDHQGSKLLEQDLELSSDDGNRRVTAGFRLRPADLGLSAGDTAIFFGTAADNRMSPYSDQPDPNVSRTENYTFRVTAQDESAEKDPETQNGSEQTGEKDGDETGKDDDNENDPSGKSKDKSGSNESGKNDAPDENKGGDENEKNNPSKDSGDAGEEEDGSSEEPGKKNSGQNDSANADNKNEPQNGEEGSSDPPENSEDGNDPESGGAGAEQSAQPPEQQPEGGGAGDESSGQGEASESESDAAGNNKGAGADAGDDSATDDGGGSSPTDPSEGDPQGQPGSEGGQDPNDGDGRKDDSLTSGAEESVSENASESQLIRKMQEHFENQQKNQSEENDSNENPQSQDGADADETSKQDDQEQTPSNGNPDNEAGNPDPQDSQNTVSDEGESGSEESGKGESGSEESGKGESGSEESGKGESGSEESGKGESGSEESGKGESGSEESGKGESGSEESGKGESGSEESGKGESGSEESGKGESGSEESGKGESGSEESGKGESGKGESGSEESGKGESGSEESGKGESGSEESGKGESGSEESGKGESGSEESGKGESGSEESGKGESGSEESGKGESGNEETGSGETDQGETTGDDPGSNKSQQSGDASQSDQPGDKPPVGEKTPGAAGEKGGNQPGGASSGKNPGAGAGDQSSSPNSKTPGGTGKGVGSAEGEQRKREKANLDHAKKATDLILNRLAEQKNDPDPELLRKLKMSKEDLEKFRNRWDEMKRKSESGDATAQRKYAQALKSLGLKPQAASSAVNQNQDNVEGLNEDGAINEPPPELVPDFNSFIRDLGRVRDNN